MAPRANWKGYLKLSLVSCPVAVYPATSEREKVRFHQINSKTGNRVRMQRIDAETGKPVEWEDVVKGYEYSKGSYVEVTKRNLRQLPLRAPGPSKSTRSLFAKVYLVDRVRPFEVQSRASPEIGRLLSGWSSKVCLFTATKTTGPCPRRSLKHGDTFADANGDIGASPRV